MSEHVVSVNEKGFLEHVLARSKHVPVLVDFWAPWCAPCRTLGPLLEQLAEASQGRFLLAKVDIDESPGLAQRHQIRGIPAVKLFRDGQVIGEFVGVQTMAEVRAFLDKHLPDASGAAALRASELILAADLAGAEAALAAAPPGESPAWLAVAARVAVLRGRSAEAKALAEKIPALADEREVGDAVLEAVALAEEGRPPAPDAQGAEARYLAAGAHLAAGRWVEALDALLEVVRLDRKLRDDAARKLLIKLFAIAGVRSDTSDAYRRKLGALL